MTGKASSSQTLDQSAATEIARCLQLVADTDGLAARIERLSKEFIGRPYAINPLGGGAGLPEHLSVSLTSFDCVTYMETVLALALSRKVAEFADYLRRIRYHKGEVSWASRNHYMVDWWQNNAAGFILNLTTGNASVEKHRRLTAVRELPAEDVRFRVFPKHNLSHVRKLIKTANFVCFASTKKNLDVFHAGILIRQTDAILLRHATRSKGAVVEQPLSDFLQAHRMSGIILLRPRQPSSTF